jgi:hypothetical protein
MTSFFPPKIADSHFFSFLESPAYISANRVGNFFYIENRPFFQNFFVKFPTHFPDRYVERQICEGSKLLQPFRVQKSVQMLIFFVKKKSVQMLVIFLTKNCSQFKIVYDVFLHYGD